MVIPDPDLDFLPIPDQGAKKATDPGSRGQKGNGSGFATLDFRGTPGSIKEVGGGGGWIG
jgi:hypothetical protein